MNIHKFFYFILFFANIATAYSLDIDESEFIQEEQSISTILVNDLKSTGKDFSILFDDLLTPSLKHIMYPLAFANTAYATSHLDLEFQVAPQHKQDIKPLRYMGEAYTGAALPATIYLGGLLFKSEEVRTTGRLLFESMALSFLVNQSVKIIAGRARPDQGLGNIEFRFFQLKDDFKSFPSGHTTAAFTIATVLSDRIDNVFASTALYLLAAGTGFQRIMQDRHWFSDVVVGAMVGTVCSKAVLNAHERAAFWSSDDEDEYSSLRYSIYPAYSFDGFSLNFTMTW